MQIQPNTIKCSSIITKHRNRDGVINETIEEKEDNQTKQQGQCSMLVKCQVLP